MTGSIEDILLGSDAAKSMRMEARIVDAFTKAKWVAQRSKYYTDVDTNKPREIDVYSRGTFTDPQKYEGTGIPILSVDVFCECKTLSGSNVIFSEGVPDKYSRRNIDSYWIGNSSEIREIASQFLLESNIEDPEIWRSVHQYTLDRAYPNDGRAINAPVSMRPPPVDMIAHAFRETRNGSNQEKGPDGTRQNPIWSAILSSISATKAARKKTKDACLSYIHAGSHKTTDIEDIISSFSFFLDAELMRNSFFHSFIVVESPLWKLTNDSIEQIKSARLCISSIDSNETTIDIVSYKHSENYIRSMAKHFSKEGRNSIAAMWKWIERVEWEPTGNEDALRALMGSTRNAKYPPKT